jgi:hypothetical protein
MVTLSAFWTCVTICAMQIVYLLRRLAAVDEVKVPRRLIPQNPSSMTGH